MFRLAARKGQRFPGSASLTPQNGTVAFRRKGAENSKKNGAERPDQLRSFG